MPLIKIEKRNLKIFTQDEITIEPSSSKKPSGGFGEINIGFINQGSIPVALKRYTKYQNRYILNKDIIKEIIILQLLNQYPETNTVQLYGLLFTNNRENCYLVLERLETTLHHISISFKNDETRNKGRLNAEQYKIIFYKLLKSIDTIHSLGFFHTDIKLTNIMLKGNDIRLIDFGLSKFIGLSPLTNQVTTYSTTPNILAPDSSRISYSTDMFSLASSMIHLCVRLYSKLKVINSIIYDEEKQNYSKYLTNTHVFGMDGHDLLLKLLNRNVQERLCAREALLHPYFDSVRPIENLEIDRSVVGMAGGINGLIYHTEYTENSYRLKNLELCYFEQMYNNYKDMICPIIPITADIMEYNQLMNWLLYKFNQRNVSQNFYGIDTIINGIILTNKYFSSGSREVILPKSIPKITHDMITTSFNISLYQQITSEDLPNFENILDNTLNYSVINTKFYEYLTDINIDFYPISIIISYIYLQLEHEIKNITISSDKKVSFNKLFFIDLCIQVIFWFVQPDPFQHSITISDIIIFCTIKLLSKILQVSANSLIEHPIIPILTMDIKQYESMMTYYTVQYKLMDFTKYSHFNIYFNKLIFNGND
jgi:serine/threonine protein kinase